MSTIIISAILLLLVFFAVRYMLKVRKSGGCVGCPDAKNCHCKSQSSGCSGCGAHSTGKG